jgi:hypothetical protein
MSEPPTILIPDIDEETTLVEARSSNLDWRAAGFTKKRGSSPTDSAARTSTSRSGIGLRWRFSLRRSAEGIVLSGVLSGFCLLGYQQWRIAESIRRSVDELSAVESPPETHEINSLPERASSQINLQADRDLLGREILEAKIEQMESFGAALIRANDFGGALNHYRDLARALPQQSVFSDLVVVLQSKMRCEHSLSFTQVGCP